MRDFVRFPSLLVASATWLIGTSSVTAQTREQEPITGELRLSPCDSAIAVLAECGTFTVWENRVARAGRTIDLNVVLLKATGENRHPDPVVYLTGGPGQGATSLTRGMADSPVRRTRDILLVDQRGTGRSNGLFCRPDAEAPAAEFMPTLDTARARRCANELSSRADLTQYLTPYAMDDLDDLRAALGYDKLNLVGTSYGTRAALVYLRRHGDHVRSIILQGSTAMSHPMPAGFAKGAEDALDGVIRDCAADSACAITFPDLRRDYQRAVSAIETGPREYSVRDPRDNSNVTVQLSARDFAESLRAMLYTPAAARLVPLLLRRAATDGDYQLFAAFQLRRNIGLSQGIAQGMYLAITCTEDVGRTDTVAAYEAGRGTFLADHRARAHFDSCRSWPRGELPDGYGEEVASDVPVLIITGQYDPATPPSDARAAASRLTNVRVVIFPHGGHSAAGLTNAACVFRLTTEFLDTTDPDGLDTDCLAEIRRPPFALSQDEISDR